MKTILYDECVYLVHINGREFRRTDVVCIKDGATRRYRRYEYRTLYGTYQRISTKTSCKRIDAALDNPQTSG